jgi:HlyD family secretion protein
MKRTRWRRRLVWGTAAAAGVAVFVYALMPSPVAVDVAVVERGSLMVTLDHEGKTRVREPFIVSAPVAGRVQRVELEPGDPVKAGQTLATFLPAPPTPLDTRSRAEAQSRVSAARATLDRVQAERERVKAELDFAIAERERVRKLAADGLTTDQARSAAETEVRVRTEALGSAEAAIAAARYELQAANATLIEPVDGTVSPGRSSSSLALRSPIAGVVLRRFRESEAVVPAGEPLLELGDPGTLEVIADFLSADAVRMRPGMPVLLEQWGGGRPLKGSVRRVEPAAFMKISALGVEEQRVWVVIAFEDPRAAWEALGDAYRVEARVIVWERSNTLKVPTSSLFRHGDDWAVFVVIEGRAHLRAVQVGERNGVSAEVRGGLGQGERVIEHPSDRVVDGVRVVERAAS